MNKLKKSRNPLAHPKTSLLACLSRFPRNSFRTSINMKKSLFHPLGRGARACLATVISLGAILGSHAAVSSPGAGEIAIYREATGGDTLGAGGSTAAGFISHDFDTNDREDAGSFTRSGADVTLNRSGRYLAIYNSRFDAAGASGTELRVEVQSYLTLDGAPLRGGWSQGFIRRQNTQDETITAGMAIFEATSGEVLQLRSFRTDTTASGTVSRSADATVLQLVKLDDINMGFARLSLGANQGGPVDATNVKVAYDTDDEVGAGFSHNGSGDLTLVNGGKYLVIANTYIGNSSNRTAMVQRLTLDGAEVPGSKTTVYMRNAQSANEGAASIGMILEATAGQVLNVEGSLDVDLTGLSYQGGRCALTVIELPSVAQGTAPADPQYIRLQNTTDQDVNSATDTALVFGTQDELGLDFAHTVGTSAVTVVADGDYLFFGSVYDNDDQVQRGFYSQGWSRSGGAKSPAGQSGRYSRNNFGADQFGNSSGFIGSGMTAFETIEMVSSALGNTGANNANRVALQGVRLNSLLTLTAGFEVIVTPTALAVTEGVGSETYEVELGLPPSGNVNVTVTVTADAQSEVSLNGTDFFASVDAVFSAGGTPQTITVRAADDSDIESDHSSVISHAITATDDPTNYPTGLSINDVNVSVTDNDVVPVTAVADVGTSNLSEDATTTEAILTPQANLLANDTDGFNNTIVSFDSRSTMGALVVVQPDGTFTYDPTVGGMAQSLPAGGSAVDTFTYTVQDSDGNTSVGSVSITLDGADDVTLTASDDFLNDGPLENGTFSSTRSLVANDGIVGGIVALTFPSGSDLRTLPGKVVSQSPSTGPPPGGGVPERALDGNPNTFTHTDSNNNTDDHIWQVDFGQDVVLEEVTLTNRQDCCAERLRDITITLLDSSGTTVYTSALLNPTDPLQPGRNTLGFLGNSGGNLIEDFGTPTTCRTLVVTRTPDGDDPNPSNGGILSLGEVTVIGSAPGTYYLPDGRLLLDYDAGRLGGESFWENKGSRGGAAMDWALSGITLDSSPGSARAGIQGAYEWDSTSDLATLAGGPSASIQDNVSGADTQNATWEFWVKPANTSSIMTLFETGGGTGFGIIINEGVLEAATGLDGGSQSGSYVSYDLVADPKGLVGGDPTTEFNQYAATITVGGGVQLYVNGVLVDETTSGTPGDWDGGDGAGLGLWGENNHGGFANGAVSTIYNAPFLGQMAIVRLYSGVLTGPEVYQNYQAVTGGTDLDGEVITAIGVIDGTGTFVPNTTQATLASGALVTMNSASGGFDYDPNGAFDPSPGQSATDSFVYRISDGNGNLSEASVEVIITAVPQAKDDSVLAQEGVVVTFAPNELIVNDEGTVTTGAYLELDQSGISGGTWTNDGSAGAARDGTALGTVLAAPTLTSGFQHIGLAPTAVTLPNLDPISTGSATIELWFRPDPGQTGQLTVYETGGNGNGFSIVYDADTNEVIATVDGGDDVNNNIVATASGVSTSEFNQLIVVIEPNGGPETGVGTNVFVDLLRLYLNNDPTAAFDPTVDGSGENLLGNANDWCGTDAGGLFRTSGTTALNENLPDATGAVAFFRVYTRVLSLAEMEVNYDFAREAITSVSSPTTVLGAPVTLNGDGTVSVDYSGVSLTPGTTTNDTFTYTTAVGTATVTVAVEALSPQEAWRLAFYGTTENTGAAEDSVVATNGLTNQQNFALGLDPTDSATTLSVNAGAGTIDSLGPPAVWVDPADGKIYLRRTRRTDLAALSLSITDQFSRGLGVFEDNNVGTNAPVVIATGTGANGEAIEAVQTEFPLILPISGGKARFARIQVSGL